MKEDTIKFALGTVPAGIALKVLTSPTLLGSDINVIILTFLMWMLSAIYTGQGLESLSRATIPVSDTVLGCFVVSTGLLPPYFTCYHLFESEDGIFTFSVLQSRDVLCKRLSTLAIITLVLDYFGYRFSWISTLVFATLELVEVTKPDLFRSRKQLLGSLTVLAISLHPFYSLGIVVLLILCFDMRVVEPYLKDLIARSPMIANIAYEQRRYIEFVCGMLATAASTYVFKYQTEDLLYGLLGLAFACLYFYASLQPCTDFGVIPFLVSSSIQCAVSVFGLLHVETVIIFLLGCAVMVFKCKMESSHFAERKMRVRKLVLAYIMTKARPGDSALLWSTLDILLNLSAVSRGRQTIQPMFKASININPFYKFGRVHPLILVGSVVVNVIAVRRRKIVSTVTNKICKICVSVRNWKWGNGNHGGSGVLTTPYYYFQFSVLLSLFLRHLRNQNHRHRLTLPPV